MRPLVVRPRLQAEQLASRLQQAGHHPIVHPLIELQPGPGLITLPQQLTQADCVIAVSQHAVQFAQDNLLQTGLNWPHIDYFAVGEASAKLWLDAGLTVTWPDDPRSEGLLGLLALQQVADRRILILRGTQGRELIADTLRQRGATVEYCATYVRHYPSQDGVALCQYWRAAGLDSLLITSAELMQTLEQTIPHCDREWLHQLPIIVPSPRVAALASQTGFVDITTAKGADDRALLEALEQRNHP